MLKISKHHYLSLPEFGPLMPRKMQLAPIPVDDGDELTQAIGRDADDHDDNWELSERPNTGELESFWEHVEQEMQNDPDRKLQLED